MKAQFTLGEKSYYADLNRPLDISIPYSSDPSAARAWYLDPLQIEPVRTEQFLGSVAEGGSVNFRTITFNPHGHGTHTECVGHIAETVYSVNESLGSFFSIAQVITVQPQVLEEKDDWMEAGDQIISKDQLKALAHQPGVQSLVIRTLPNGDDKLKKNYSDSNPPYLHTEAMKFIVGCGIENLLIDLPSVDRELDGGELRCHHLFWEHPLHTNTHRTITELIHVPNNIKDGIYLLELQVAPFINDASPSRPVLYPLLDH